MPYKTVSNNEGTHIILDGVEIAIKSDRATALEFIAGHALHRAEAAEAERDTAWAELREIRMAINADDNEATSDEVRRVVHQRDDLRQKLEQAQKLIEELYNAWGDAPLMVAERHDRIDAMTKAATIHYEAQS